MPVLVPGHAAGGFTGSLLRTGMPAQSYTRMVCLRAGPNQGE